MDQRIHYAMIVMKNNRNVPVEDLAYSVNLSLSRFQHLFKSQTRMSPMHYRRMLRMEDARHLIQTSRLSLRQIMDTVGIKDRIHFDPILRRLLV
jgi:transcriptional regulator GlxA family with amidase domain